MFIRKLTVLLVPLGMLLLLCLLIPLFGALDAFFGPLLLGTLLGILAGATRMREPFAWLLWIPSAVILLILLYQFLATQQLGHNLPVLRLLITGDPRIIIAEASFAAYMMTFSLRTGRGI